MLRQLYNALTLCAALLLVPVAASAQATLAGLVRDSSGAVMPGVTVEASSDALIEKVRTALTDTAGQYRIIDLPPGQYTVTFALDGFTTVKRSAASTTTINLFETNEESYPQISVVDMRIGKIFRINRMRANVGVDVFNLLNSSTGQTYNNTYAITAQNQPAANAQFYGTPTLILPARFAKVSLQIDF